jgi:hypothetical protein
MIALKNIYRLQQTVRKQQQKEVNSEKRTKKSPLIAGLNPYQRRRHGGDKYSVCGRSKECQF